MNDRGDYGKYAVPETIKELLKFEEELKDNGLSLDFHLGLIMEGGRFRYISTPPDVIPFASAGVDGIYYGFLTDFGTISDLEQAYIVCVSPMDIGDEVWLVAPSIRDFLRVVYTDNIILYNHFRAADDLREHMQQRETEYDSEERLQAKRMLRERFAIEPIPDMPRYIAELSRKRAEEIALSTKSPLGVVRWSPDDSVEGARLIPDENTDLESVRHFFLKAPRLPKLAFIRDAQTSQLLYDDPEIRKLVTNELIDMGLEEEAVQLNIPFEEVESYSQQIAPQYGESTLLNLTWIDEETFE